MVANLTRILPIKSKKWNEVGPTPLLVPSLSSRVNLPMRKTIGILGDVVTGPFLISAYDFHYTRQFPEISFSELLFLDSGGYEVAKENDVDIGLYKPDSKPWTRSLHLDSINKWPKNLPTVVISYDHPKERQSLQSQIQHATELFQNRDDVISEFLIKPETKISKRVDLKNLLNSLELLADFDILGITEKELGKSILENMIAIAKIRLKMKDIGMEKPLHIFGSLDPITTPLYYFSGADIFDGLSWLRFIFDNGCSMYVDSFGPKKEGIHQKMEMIRLSSIYNNYSSLTRLKLDLEKFHSTKQFQIFGDNANFFENACADLDVKLGGVE